MSGERNYNIISVKVPLSLTRHFKLTDDKPKDFVIITKNLITFINEKHAKTSQLRKENTICPLHYRYTNCRYARIAHVRF